MKKLCIFLCCLLILPMLAACGSKAEDFNVPVHYYFSNREISYNKQNGVIQAEIREGADLQGNLTAYLHSYLRGPVSSDLIRIIPSDVYLVSCNLNGKTAEIVFSNQFSNLTGLELVSACSSLMLSVNAFTGADTICISAKNALINEKDVFVITMDDIVLTDHIAIKE